MRKINIKDIKEHEILFYDLETTHQYPAYCDVNLIGVKYGFKGRYERVCNVATKKRFQDALLDPDIIKVGFNCKNFDDIVLKRHDYEIDEENAHDGYLMMKAIAPMLPSYSLKFINWWFLGDPHFPEMELEQWAKQTGQDKWSAPNELLEPYLAHDLEQHKNVFQLAWQTVQDERYWESYLNDLKVGNPIHEMVLEGGLLIDGIETRHTVARLQNEIEELKDAANYFSDGRITNPNSSKQLGDYFDEQGFALSLSDNGNFAVRMDDLIDLRDRSEVAECAYQTRKIHGSLSFFKNYATAIQDSSYALINGPDWIPTAFNISSARTRRFTSNSYYRLNFQNPDSEAKKVQLVPDGWLGFWWDATQVENIVHIYESEDEIRRRAYESDPNWSEYVWLCNLILGTSKSKDELDDIPSPQVPKWSVYKQFKTAKLALNFGMGVAKFCKTTGVSPQVGKSTFNKIHEACPAIHRLQDKVRKLVEKYGYVQDVFGYNYSHSSRMAYKLVAYLIQGCGTGSLPKAQIRALYNTIHSFDLRDCHAGVLCTTTHDEIGGRLNLEQGVDRIFAILQKTQYDMTERFSPKFAGIPLRAKLYLSRTTTEERQEIKNLTLEKIKSFLT